MAARIKKSKSLVTPIPTPLAPGPVAPGGKLGQLVGLLQRADGATLDDMIAATGWQAHSVRGAMSGSLKKKLGLDITSTKTEAGRVYRIEPGAGA